MAGKLINLSSNNKGFSAWEFTLALLIISLMVILASNIYFGILQSSKEATLKSTLGSIRSAATVIFRAKNKGSLPDGVTPGQRIEDLMENALPPVDLGDIRKDGTPPISNKVFIDKSTDERPMKLPLNSQGGYAYKPATGEIRLNVDPSFKDSDGKAFSEY